MTTPYDELAYPSYAFDRTQPDRLATHAALFGLSYAAADACRVLEIGCGDGVNLIAMAVTRPDATFVGFDLSEAAISRGRELVEALALPNVRLEARDLTHADFGAGAFDYAIAHGVYSWIPAAAREALLASIRHHLGPNGVGFVSHNALPGGRAGQVVREMVLFQIRGVEGIARRVEAGRAQLKQIAEEHTDQSPFHAMVHLEASKLLQRSAAGLAHDELSDVYEPFYLHEFISAAGRHGLQYLTEASATRCGEGFRPPYALDDPTFDVLAHAQTLDFQAARPYRENLVVHAEAAIDRRPEPSRLFPLFVAACATEAAPGEFDVGPRRFTLEDERLAAAMRRICAAWPQALPVAELVDDEERAAVLLRMYWLGLVDLHSAPLPVCTVVGDRPKAGALTRLQATRGKTMLTTAKLGSLEIRDEIGRAFIARLDGVRTVDELAHEMAIEAGLAPAEARAQVDAKLKELAALALLV
jgi:SAM-dependent methyltransferase